MERTTIAVEKRVARALKAFNPKASYNDNLKRILTLLNWLEWEDDRK